MTSSPHATPAPSAPATGARPGRAAATGRACGKVILLGEHAVVYGIPALALGIDRGALATAAPKGEGRSTLEVPAWNVVVDEGDTRTDLGQAFTALVAASRAGSPGTSAGVRVTASADLPPGGGLGCSAALGVAVARALVPGAEAARVAELAGFWERVFHGNPSGIDAAVAAYGGSILFKRGAPMDRVTLKGPLTVCVGSTGVASSTKTMVDGVARLRERKPEVVEKTFAGIASLVENGRLALEAGDTVGLGKLMDLNQMLLSGLMLSTEEIERLCSSARDAGALGAKLTGAGGGGCVVALATDADAGARVVEVWARAGFTGFVASVHAESEAS